MNLDAIVTQLETVDGLSGNVQIGQPERIEGITSGPYAWLSEAMESASPSGRVNQPSIQRIDCRVGITIGAQAMADVLSTREAIRWALIDLDPEGTAGAEPLQFRGGQLAFLDTGWTYWRDEYAYSYYVDLLNPPEEPEPDPVPEGP
jgi:hypothetical protein